jgi:hypothetical protein
MHRVTLVLFFLVSWLSACVPETSSSIADPAQKLDPQLAGQWTLSLSAEGTVSLVIAPQLDDRLAVEVRFGERAPERFRAHAAGQSLIAGLAELTRDGATGAAQLPDRFVIGYRTDDNLLSIYVPSSPPVRAGASAAELRRALQEIDAFGDAPLLFDRKR